MMEEIKYLNVKEFSYRIEIDDKITKIYDEEIKSVIDKMNGIKEEVKLYEQLVSLSDEEIKRYKSKEDYNTLVSDKEYFVNVLTNYKNMITEFGTVLNQLNAKKYNVNKFITSIKYYNDNIDNINSIIKNYNYDIIFNEKNIKDINIINEFKNELYNIIYFDYSNISTNIDINILKKEYNKLSDIESYYKSEHKVNNKLKTNDDYNLTDYDGFIFINSENNVNDYSNSNIEGNIDYIAYCDEVSCKKRKNHKIINIKKSNKWNKIKKSLKKNIGKVIAGLLVGVTMLGASTITTGFDKSNSSNKDFNTKTISTMDSANENNKVVKNEKSTEIDTTTNNFKDTKEPIKINIDNNLETQNNNKKDCNVKEKVKEIKTDKKIQELEITIGTKVTASSKIYINANNAYNKINNMTPYYPISDEREVSLIYYKSDDGNTVLISNSNKNRIEELKRLKYEVVAYCLDNVTHNIGEGWYNKDDVKVLVK